MLVDLILDEFPQPWNGPTREELLRIPKVEPRNS